MTLEITKDAHITERGDCIVAICASKGAADLSPEFHRLVRNEDARITVTLEAAGQSEVIIGRGDSRLTLSHPADLVARKSNYVCRRTLMVEADRSASDLKREFVTALRNQNSMVTIEICAEI
jgi:hypothetical protein